MEIFIIIAALVFIAFAAKVLFGTTKKQVMSSNPIDGIRPSGVMGFEIGDSYAFCLSRFRHLNIDINSNDLIGNNDSGFVVFGRGEYNNINEVRCRFEQGYLFSVTIDVDYSKDGITDMYGILMSRICRILKKEPSCEEIRKKTWSYAHTDVMLLRHIVPIIEKENLLVQVTFS